LNGFHPLYRALFDQRPGGITICAWDNVELSRRLRGEPRLLAELLRYTREVKRSFTWPFNSALAKGYLDHYWAPNIALTDLLPGQIEFHHTALFPTFRRPFVFHCESFAPVFFPFAHQGTGTMTSHGALRDHYRSILSSPLCLGIFSHIPETLQSLSTFFADSEIDRKLHSSRIGLSSRSFPNEVPIKQSTLSQARFLFVNSANQNPANFFYRGGHIVLRFWKEFRSTGKLGRLYLRCVRPTDEELKNHDIDLAFLRNEESDSVVWIEDYLANHELNALMSDAHFFLLPSVSLHSVSIMQAMASGTVPVVTDTVGTSVYVTDDENGVVLKGVLAASWDTDPETGILVDHYRRNPVLDDQLVSQLTQRIFFLLAAPHAYEQMRLNALERSRSRFSGAIFSEDFWSNVSRLHANQRGNRSGLNVSRPSLAELADCMLKDSEWPRVFESATQPYIRLYTGSGRVSELGGAFIHTFGDPQMELHDWSVVAEHVKRGAPQLKYAKTIRGLEGNYLFYRANTAPNYRRQVLIAFVSRVLKPYPALHRLGSRVLGKVRQLYQRALNKKGAHQEEPEDLYLSFQRNMELVEDIQLVIQDLAGFNVVRCLDKFYAIPQTEGEFVVEKANAGGYSSCFIGNTLGEIRRQIAAADSVAQADPLRPSQGKPRLELVLGGVFGFNIVRFAGDFYAIPESEGAFDHARLIAGDYSRVFSGRSAEEVQKLLKEYVCNSMIKESG
jgi:glycosyltransferase involved in cell wall biosynthesis